MSVILSEAKDPSFTSVPNLARGILRFQAIKTLNDAREALQLK